MPFKPPWCDYKKGDLFYGLGEERAELIKTLRVKTSSLHMIDQYGGVGGRVGQHEAP